ncbi:Uncharacterised protein [Chlamydia trachomatis]|nr:Uncharacterised protein [Chlamydia trachomatis]SYV91251.1 Uncharacterised protein [Mesomycoplasma hyorhinis]
MIKRSYKNEAIIAYLNLTSKEIKAQFHNNFQLLSSYKDKKIVKSVFRPFESILIKKQL